MEITDKMSKRWGTGTVCIPALREVDQIMAEVPRGKVVTTNEIRAYLARKHNAIIDCPITTGIFAWIAAHAAEEASAEGKTGVTPYWRTLKSGGEINPKYPGGIEAQAARLEEEGHELIPAKGKKSPKVKDYEKVLVEL